MIIGTANVETVAFVNLFEISSYLLSDVFLKNDKLVGDEEACPIVKKSKNKEKKKRECFLKVHKYIYIYKPLQGYHRSFYSHRITQNNHANL